MIQWTVRNGEWQKLQHSGEHRLLLNTGLRHRGGLGVDGTVLDGGGGIHANVCLDLYRFFPFIFILLTIRENMHIPHC